MAAPQRDREARRRHANTARSDRTPTGTGVIQNSCGSVAAGATTGAAPGRLQFITADNELPEAYGRDFAEVVFSIAEPTVPTVRHPGPANVEVVGAEGAQ